MNGHIYGYRAEDDDGKRCQNLTDFGFSYTMTVQKDSPGYTFSISDNNERIGAIDIATYISTNHIQFGAGNSDNTGVTVHADSRIKIQDTSVYYEFSYTSHASEDDKDGVAWGYIRTYITITVVGTLANETKIDKDGTVTYSNYLTKTSSVKLAGEDKYNLVDWSGFDAQTSAKDLKGKVESHSPDMTGTYTDI